jgi:hypothetical protein
MMPLCIFEIDQSENIFEIKSENPQYLWKTTPFQHPGGGAAWSSG